MPEEIFVFAKTQAVVVAPERELGNGNAELEILIAQYTYAQIQTFFIHC